MASDWESAPRRRQWRAAVVVGVALGVGLGIVALQRTDAASDGGRLHIAPAGTGVPLPAASPSASAAGWRRLPDPPLPPRTHPLTLWADDEVLVLGGDGRRDGAAWDPSRQRWRRLPNAPVPLYSNVAVWTGDQAIVVTPDATLHLDPTAATWERGPSPPHGLLRDMLPSGDAATVGDVVVVAGTDDPAAAAYDVTQRRWRTLDVPSTQRFLHTPAVTVDGETVLLFGDDGHGTLGWSLRLADERLRPMPAVPDAVMPEATRLVWFGAASSVDATYVLGRTLDATAWRVAELERSPSGAPRRWHATPDVPLEAHREAIVAWVGDGLVVLSTELATGTIYRPARRRWELLPPAPLAMAAGVGTAVPGGLFVWVENGAAVWTP